MRTLLLASPSLGDSWENHTPLGQERSYKPRCGNCGSYCLWAFLTVGAFPVLVIPRPARTCLLPNPSTRCLTTLLVMQGPPTLSSMSPVPLHPPCGIYGHTSGSPPTPGTGVPKVLPPISLGPIPNLIYHLSIGPKWATLSGLPTSDQTQTTSASSGQGTTILDSPLHLQLNMYRAQFITNPAPNSSRPNRPLPSLAPRPTYYKALHLFNSAVVWNETDIGSSPSSSCCNFQ